MPSVNARELLDNDFHRLDVPEFLKHCKCFYKLLEENRVKAELDEKHGCFQGFRLQPNGPTLQLTVDQRKQIRNAGESIRADVKRLFAKKLKTLSVNLRAKLKRRCKD